MFAKLLKYDLRAVFKYWWIAAVSSLGLSVIGGVCINIITVDYTSFQALQSIAILGLVISIIGLCVFGVLSEILILVRFYKNFFSDEGYLTFTLPVRKTQLLNSKLLMSVIFTASTTLVILFDIFLMLAVGIPEEIFNRQLIEGMFKLVGEIFGELGLYTIVYLLEFVVMVIAAQLLSILMIVICLTFAAVITRKSKVIAGIGIYYLANSAITTIVQTVVFTGGFYRVFYLMEKLDKNGIMLTLAILLLGLIALICAAVVGLYYLETYLLDRRLNLE